MQGYLATLPAFAGYFAASVALLGLFVTIYIRLTPHREIALVREGNTAAAVSLGGAVLGYALALAGAASQAVGIVDLVAWGVVALVAQGLAYFAARLIVPNLSEAIAAGAIAPAVLHAALAVAVGLINAASMAT